MRKKRTFTTEEKISIIQEAEKYGVVTTCRKYGIYSNGYYIWKRKYEQEGIEGLKPQYIKRNEYELKRIQRENDKLKVLLAEKELELQLKTELLKKRQWKTR